MLYFIFGFLLLVVVLIVCVLTINHPTILKPPIKPVLGESRSILEWFNELDEPYRTQAINNTVFLNSWGEEMLKSKELSLTDALKGAFTWRKSLEGYNYWSELFIKLEKQPK